MRKQYLELPPPPRYGGGQVGLSTHEAALVEALLPWIPQLVPLDAGALYVIPELGTDHGIADVVAMVLPSRWLSQRVKLGAPPITGRAAAYILSTFHRSREMEVRSLRERVHLPEDTYRRTLAQLRQVGAIVMRDNAFQIHSALYLNGFEHAVAIEAKMSDWLRGLRQASAYSIFAPFSYLAVPASLAPSVKSRRDFFSRNGVGVVAIEDSLPRVVIRARRRTAPSRLHRVLLRERLFGRYQLSS